MKLFLSILIILISIVIPACVSSETKKEKVASSTGIDIEKIKLTNLKGDAFDLNKYLGKTVFINFWATWCKPCKEEMPTIKNVMDSLKNKNITFLFASDETADQIQSFEAAHNYDLNYFMASNMEELNIMALPTTFIFNKNGELVFSETGYRKWDEPANIDLILKIVEQ